MVLPRAEPVETGVVLHGRSGAVARTALRRLTDDIELERATTETQTGDARWPTASSVLEPLEIAGLRYGLDRIQGRLPSQ